jgi:Do/DeqQ family serine protease
MEDTRRSWIQRHGRLALGGVTAAALVTGAAWHGLAANNTPAAAAATDASAQTPAVARTLAGGRDSYADIVKIVAPAVVTIRTEGHARMRQTSAPEQGPEDLFRYFFGDEADQFRAPGRRGPGQGTPRVPQFRRGGLGSGVIVTPDGYILTNHHVVDSADGIEVELSDGRTFTAKVIGTDQPSDLALLKIDATNLQALALGDSEKVEVGDVVLAVGNPLGLGQTVTMGIVSAKGRRSDRGAGRDYEDFLQTDAPINQGNSGGALVNLKGELIGINAQIASMTGGNIGIGFAIPANMARHVMTDLKTSGHVRRAQLGVNVQEVNSDLAASMNLKDVRGAIVTGVEHGSAAEKAGVKQGDVIVSFAGRPVRDVNSLRNRVAESTPGSRNPLVIMRDGVEQTLTLTLDEAEATRAAANGENPADGANSSALGVRVSPLTPEVARREGIAPDTKGVIVNDVDPDSRAASAGLQPGDVIKQVNRQSIANVDELRAAVKKTTDRPILMLVNREGRDLFLTVRPS